MKIINIHDAKKNLSRLVDSGEEIIIGKAGKAIARLAPIPAPIPKVKRVFGSLKGKVRIAKDFDAPLPNDIIALFEGR